MCDALSPASAIRREKGPSDPAGPEAGHAAANSGRHLLGLFRAWRKINPICFFPVLRPRTVLRSKRSQGVEWRNRARVAAGRRGLRAPGRRAAPRRQVRSRRQGLAPGRLSSKACANGFAPKPVPAGYCRGCYFAADHEPVLPVAATAAIVFCAAAFLLRRRKILPDRRYDISDCRGLCRCDLEDRASCARRAGPPGLFGLVVGLCRDPRHPRAHRPLRAPRCRNAEPTRVGKTRARPALG